MIFFKLNIKSITRINTIFFLFLVQQQAFAEVEPRLSIGGTVNFNYQAYKHTQNDPDITYMPAFFYDNQRVYAEGDEIGAYLYEDKENEFRVNAYYDGMQFDPKNSDFNGISKRKWSIMAGVSYMRVTPFGGFKLQVGSDVLSRHSGTVVTASYLAELQSGNWTWYPELGLNWNNKNYNQYYFGVTHQESKLNNIEEYNPKSSVSPYASLNGSYFINNHFNIIFGAEVNYLTNQMFNSPLVKNRFDVEPFVGALYKF